MVTNMIQNQFAHIHNLHNTNLNKMPHNKISEKINEEQIKITSNVFEKVNEQQNHTGVVTTDTTEISADAKLEYQYSQEIMGTNKNDNNQSAINGISNNQDTFLSKDSIDPSFIKDYALRYAKIKDEISKTCSEDEANKKINLLDKAYNDAIKNATDKLASDFNKFFNYSSYEWNDPKDNGKKFDMLAFEKNVISLADKSKALVDEALKNNNLNELSNKIDKELSNIKSGNTVETMNYNDIKVVDDFLKSIPNFNNYKRHNLDDGSQISGFKNWSVQDAANAMNKEHDMAENLSTKDGLSDLTCKYVNETVDKNIAAFHKAFAMGNELDNDQSEINKDNALYKLLKSQYDEFQKKADEAKKKKNDKMALFYLKSALEMKDSLDAAKNKLKDDADSKDKLEKDHNSVTKTGTYKDISSRLNFKEINSSDN